MPRRTNQVTRNARNSSFRANAGEDRISILPGCILSQILSLLPTKDVVRTSVLSRDWEYKWCSIHNVSIDETERYDGRRSNKTRFAQFVDSVLFHTQGLRSFRLSCRCNFGGRLEGWISSALESNIECLELKALQSFFNLPRNLLNKASLRILKLKSFCNYKVPQENHFPHLTYLHFRSVRIHNELSNSDRLVFTLPVLKTLKLKKCIWYNVKLVEIHSPALSTFVCETSWKPAHYSIKISGARLERFESIGVPETIIFDESTILNVVLRDNLGFEDNGENNDLHAPMLLKWFLSANSLHLSQWTYKVMALAKQNLQLPRYDRLQRLVIRVWHETKLLIELLHSAPSLKYLEIYGNGGELSHEQVDNVPHCVTSHLEEVKLVSINEEALLHLAVFFLTNGANLKKVCVNNYFPWNVYVEQISRYPRASSRVEIVSG